MKTLEELKARIAELARQYKEVRQMPVAKINQSPTATKFTVIEVSDFVAKLDSIKKLIASADKAVLTPALIAEFKEAISAFMLKFSTSSESQQKQLVAVKGRAEAVAVVLGQNGNNSMVATVLFKSSFDNELDIIESGFLTLRSNMNDLHDKLLFKINSCILDVIEPVATSYNDAKKNIEDALSAHKDIMKASADTFAAILSIMGVTCLGILSTSGLIATALVSASASLAKHKEFIINAVNIVEDFGQIALDKGVTTNVTVQIPDAGSNIKKTPSKFRQERLSAIWEKWKTIVNNINPIRDSLSLHNNFIQKIRDKKISVPTLKQKQFIKDYTVIYQTIQDNLNTTIKDIFKSLNNLDCTPLDVNIWTAHFERTAWSKIIPTLKIPRMIQLPTNVLNDDSKLYDVQIGSIYQSISWPLINRWKALDILSSSNCLGQEINFDDEFFFWEKWNDDIDLLVDWAKCYTLPVLPQNIK